MQALRNEKVEAGGEVKEGHQNKLPPGPHKGSECGQAVSYRSVGLLGETSYKTFPALSTMPAAT